MLRHKYSINSLYHDKNTNASSFLDTENETDIDPENLIIFSDSDITSLVTWYQGLANLEYK